MHVKENKQSDTIDDQEIVFTERIVYKFPPCCGKKVYTKFALEGPY